MAKAVAAAVFASIRIVFIWLKWNSSIVWYSVNTRPDLFLLRSSPLSFFCFRRCLLHRLCCRAESSRSATFFSGFVLPRGTRSWIPGSTSYSDVPYWNAFIHGWTGPAAPWCPCTRLFPRLSGSSRADRWEERSGIRSTDRRIWTDSDKVNLQWWKVHQRLKKWTNPWSPPLD